MTIGCCTQEEEAKLKPGTDKAIAFQALKQAGAAGLNINQIIELAKQNGVTNLDENSKRVIQFVSFHCFTLMHQGCVQTCPSCGHAGLNTISIVSPATKHRMVCDILEDQYVACLLFRRFQTTRPFSASPRASTRCVLWRPRSTRRSRSRRPRASALPARRPRALTPQHSPRSPLRQYLTMLPEMTRCHLTSWTAAACWRPCRRALGRKTSMWRRSTSSL